LKNRFRSMLVQYHFVEVELSRAFSRKLLRVLQQKEFPQSDQRCLDSLLDTMDAVDERIQEAEKWIEEKLIASTQVDRIRQIPIIGLIMAKTILSEIGEIQRFKNAKALCSFVGLVPTMRASAEHVFYGRLSKQASHWLRWVSDSHPFSLEGTRLAIESFAFNC
jgi:transposase